MKMGQTIIKMYRNMLTLPQSIFSRDVGIMKNKFNKIKEEIIKQMTDCQPKNSNDGKKKKKTCRGYYDIHPCFFQIRPCPVDNSRKHG